VPTYELRRGGWIEIDEAPRRLTGWRLGAMAAFAIAAAVLMVMLLPLGALVAWLAKRGTR
jgi:hypothetical protein